MTRRSIDGIQDVAEFSLCTGCGACAFAQPDAIEMVDDLDAGRRPVVRSIDGRLLPTVKALEVCPGVGLEQTSSVPDEITELRAKWGPVLDVWEGWATDRGLRHAASSGGIASALALHSIEQQGYHGLLHIRSRRDAPHLNETVLSTHRDTILGSTGSRYAPASPCDRLDLLRNAPAPCVFVGKPCDVAATWKLRQTDDLLDQQLGLTVAIFCAGTPTTRGTLEMLARMGIPDPDALVSLRYRGNGWPGDAVAEIRDTDGSLRSERLTYDESWGEVLQRHRQWRCYVCADHTGQFADIAVGDPWYRSVGGDDGRSLILVRTKRGQRILAAALAAGDVVAQQVSPSRVPDAQPGLRDIRGAVGGRIAVLRLLRIPAPRYSGFPMLQVWWRDLSLREKFRSTIGTLRRVQRKRLRHRHPVRPLEPPT